MNRAASSRPATAPPGPGLGRLRVVPQAGRPGRGWLLAGSLALPCSLGPSGLVRRKREGDGGTPVGTFALLGGSFRADRGPRLAARLPLRPARADDGWCDDPAHRRYNQPVRLPFRASHETLWRADRLYDVVLDMDYNRRQPRPGRGSAIFLHVRADTGGPTAGCVALDPGDLRRLLPRLRRGCLVQIG